MVYADEVNDPKEIPELDAAWPTSRSSDRELAMATPAGRVARRPTSSRPSSSDTYREQVLDLIERKAAGETELVAAPAAVSQDKVVDLMAALEASVAAAKEARKRHPTGRDDAADDDEPADEPAAKAKPAAKKRSRRTPRSRA